MAIKQSYNMNHAIYKMKNKALNVGTSVDSSVQDFQERKNFLFEIIIFSLNLLLFFTLRLFIFLSRLWWMKKFFFSIRTKRGPIWKEKKQKQL